MHLIQLIPKIVSIDFYYKQNVIFAEPVQNVDLFLKHGQSEEAMIVSVFAHLGYHCTSVLLVLLIRVGRMIIR